MEISEWRTLISESLSNARGKDNPVMQPTTLNTSNNHSPNPICSVCHEAKPRSEFWKNNAALTGLFPYCKDCANKRKQAKAVPQSEKPIESVPSPVIKEEERVHRCYRCNEYKPISEFYANRTKKNGMQDECKTCTNGRLNGKPQSHVQPQTQPTAVQSTSQFIIAGSYFIGTSSIACIDFSRPGKIEIKLNIHEVNSKGFPEAISYEFSGQDAVAVRSAIEQVTMGAPTDLLNKLRQLESEQGNLRNMLSKAETERESAMELAQQMEQKYNKLKTALNDL